MIVDYDTLKAAVGDFLNRGDLAAAIPVWVQLAEAEINRNLRHWQQEQLAPLTLTGRYTDLPADWRETVRLEAGGKRMDLLAQPELQIRRSNSEDAAGAPAFYAFTAGKIEVYPTPDGDYSAEHLYLGDIPALSDASPTNWLLEKHPDIYLYGALLHSAPYLVEDARLQVWRGLYAEALIAAQRSSDKARASGAMKITVR